MSRWSSKEAQKLHDENVKDRNDMLERLGEINKEIEDVMDNEMLNYTTASSNPRIMALTYEYDRLSTRIGQLERLISSLYDEYGAPEYDGD